MANIVNAMKEHGVRRLVATATPSYRDARDRFDLSFSLAVLIVRLPLLSDEPSSDPPHVGYVGEWSPIRVWSIKLQWYARETCLASAFSGFQQTAATCKLRRGSEQIEHRPQLKPQALARRAGGPSQPDLILRRSAT